MAAGSMSSSAIIFENHWYKDKALKKKKKTDKNKILLKFIAASIATVS